jgi:hypothetical protein
MLLIRTQKVGRVGQDTAIATIPRAFADREGIRTGGEIVVGARGHVLILAAKGREADVLALVSRLGGGRD